MQKYFNSHYHIATLILFLILSLLFFATYVNLSQTMHVILAVLILFATMVTLYVGIQVGLVLSLIVLFVIGSTLIAIGLKFPFTTNLTSVSLSFEMFVVFGLVFLIAVVLAGLIQLRVKTFFAEREQLQSDLSMYTSLDIITSFDKENRMQIDIKREIERIRRHGGLFTLLFLEMDNFKEFENIYGAAEVEHLLKEIGQKVNDSTRTTDRKYRFSANQFALLLPDTRKDTVELIIDKLAPRLQRHQLLNKKIVTLRFHVSYEEYNRNSLEITYEEFISELERELVLYAM
jgi:diguanylate cyclase (GGDEF)-like protein